MMAFLPYSRWFHLTEAAAKVICLYSRIEWDKIFFFLTKKAGWALEDRHAAARRRILP